MLQKMFIRQDFFSENKFGKLEEKKIILWGKIMFYNYSNDDFGGEPSSVMCGKLTYSLFCAQAKAIDTIKLLLWWGGGLK